MPLFPFTPAGADDKLAELYALTDPLLAVEANSIQTDFRAWVIANFDLDSSQTDFLNDMSDRTVTYLGEQCSLCFINRLPIHLVKPLPPVAPGYAKQLETVNNIETVSDGTGGVTVTGSLTITIVYIP